MNQRAYRGDPDIDDDACGEAFGRKTARSWSDKASASNGLIQSSIAGLVEVRQKLTVYIDCGQKTDRTEHGQASRADRLTANSLSSAPDLRFSDPANAPWSMSPATLNIPSYSSPTTSFIALSSQPQKSATASS
ncbi:hypothetical protein K435DRAFT_862408 [Dendrothele bispora CBS 962.96]|uniref:Uncharacterized protein n=1 Tax=Dendrothele bispora (strain CBS 962.96) TaxID=1314807 RepID=A0A4S8LU40_DENBC|nr:hypothetical protein K435DRAFT_862408 [Dendrothele bispora CBS 962.96]